MGTTGLARSIFFTRGLTSLASITGPGHVELALFLSQTCIYMELERAERRSLGTRKTITILSKMKFHNGDA